MTDPGTVEVGEIHTWLPKGDPIYTIYTWRADSLTLLKMRPVIEQIVVLAEAPCENRWQGTTCLDDTGRQFDTGESATSYCWPCRLKTLRARLYGYRDQPPKEGTPA